MRGVDFLSLLLKVGFYTGMIFLFAGFFAHFPQLNLQRAGVEILLATPMVFVGAVSLWELFEKRVARAAVAFALFILLILNAFVL